MKKFSTYRKIKSFILFNPTPIKFLIWLTPLKILLSSVTIYLMFSMLCPLLSCLFRFQALEPFCIEEELWQKHSLSLGAMCDKASLRIPSSYQQRPFGNWDLGFRESRAPLDGGGQAHYSQALSLVPWPNPLVPFIKQFCFCLPCLWEVTVACTVTVATGDSASNSDVVKA